MVRFDRTPEASCISFETANVTKLTKMPESWGGTTIRTQRLDGDIVYVRYSGFYKRLWFSWAGQLSAVASLAAILDFALLIA